jgi:hypothetical protein
MEIMSSRNSTVRDRGSSGIVTLVGAAVIIGGLLVVAAVVGVSLWGTPFETTTIDRTQPPVLIELTDLAEYHAASGEFQVLVDLEKDVQYLPAALAGEKVLYIGVGSVDAVVDFTSLEEDAVRIDPDTGAVTVTLPAPTLEDVVLDIEQSRVADRDRGLFDRIGGLFSDNPTGEQDLQIAAAEKIADAAAASGITDLARANTESMLRGLFGQLGHDDVTIAWFDPTVQ